MTHSGPACGCCPCWPAASKVDFCTVPIGLFGLC